jgi:hypothetical protein
MSNMSRWLGPPKRFKRMMDLARGGGFAGPWADAWSRRGSVIEPKSDSPPARNTSRRVVPSQVGARLPRICSIETSRR